MTHVSYLVDEVLPLQFGVCIEEVKLAAHFPPKSLTELGVDLCVNLFEVSEEIVVGGFRKNFDGKLSNFLNRTLTCCVRLWYLMVSSPRRP